MKHSLRILLLTAVATLCAIASVSCQKEGAAVSGAPLPEASDEIVFTAGGAFDATVETKATAVTSLSSVNVLCVTGTAGSSETTVFNSVFNSGAYGYSGGKYWPLTDQSYKFYASNVDMTPAATGPTVSATTETDVVCAVLTSPTYKASNTLTMNHIFARVGYCRIMPPTDHTVSNLSVTITPKTGGTYSLFAGNGKTDGTGWSNVTTGTSTVIATQPNTRESTGVYLVPGSYQLTASYTLSIGDYSESFTKTSTVNLVGGKVNNITSTLPNSNATELKFVVTVAEWGQNSIEATFN